MPSTKGHHMIPFGNRIIPLGASGDCETFHQLNQRGSFGDASQYLRKQYQKNYLIPNLYNSDGLSIPNSFNVKKCNKRIDFV